MGRRLAIEVTKYLELLKKPFKLSFIGHSMGGLIIRSALGFITHLHKNLHAYVSICSPHLGYLYTASKLVQAGLWLLNTWQKCDSIIELSMQDN
jgi:triacylglycerol esterase/lipase EstA (alpha/beta hydrolase family)